MAIETAIDAITYSLVGGALLVAAFWDVKTRRIPNQISLFLIALFVGTTAARILQGSDPVETVFLPLAGGAAVFAGTFFLFWRGYLGGGDAKLLTVLALFTPFSLILPMLWIMAVAGGVLALTTLIWTRIKDRKVTVPYGVAITIAGLWVCLQEVALVTTLTANA